LIRPFLQHLRERAAGAEIIVVDGGSDDETATLAKDFCDQLLQSERGRARQLNAGAKAAHGDVLWFLHVDAEVPVGCLEQIRHLLGDQQTVGGFFRIRLPRSAMVFRLTDSFAHYAGLALRMRCGDHGMFCRRDEFETINGFPDVPLMEDIAFFRNLRKRGHIQCIGQRIVASPRRYEEIGPLRLSLSYGFLAVLYGLGAPMSTLIRIYKRTCCRRK
jgi:rSAM/selenodomain-associated transferase 2